MAWHRTRKNEKPRRGGAVLAQMETRVTDPRHRQVGPVRARRRVWKPGRRSPHSARSGTTEKYHDTGGLFGEAKVNVREKDLRIQIRVGDCVVERAAIGTECAGERTGRLSCHGRNFVQTPEAGLEVGDIVVRSCCRDTERGDE